jgi:hypothetical protein
MEDPAAISRLFADRPTPDSSSVVYDKARNVRERMKVLASTGDLDLDLLSRRTSEALGFLCRNEGTARAAVPVHLLEGFLYDHRALGYDTLCHLEQILNQQHGKPDGEMNGHAPAPLPTRRRLPSSLRGAE